jgi:hypothetical protein
MASAATIGLSRRLSTGLDACQAYCKSGATFSAQIDVLANISTLQQYAEWRRNLVMIFTDGRHR